jgi:FMN phosphatase YigB (HAD superfamily)
VDGSSTLEKAGKLIVLDIDNTVFNWVEYYVACMNALANKVASIIGSTAETLFHEARVIFEKEGSIEYPFLVQELPTVMQYYGSDVERMLREAVEPGRMAFNEAAQNTLVPYAGVMETMKGIKQRWPHIPVIALTDAPRYVAMWKLNKLHLLPFFDAVYGLPDPRIPADVKSQKVKVDPEILMKHLQKSNFDFAGRIRVLPDDYEKPGTKGLKTVLMDFEMESHLKDVLWVGDNLRKDVGLGRRLGVHTGWARYGTVIQDSSKKLLLEFSPQNNVAKNVALDPASQDAPQPDFVLETFSDMIPAIEQLLTP